MQAFLDIPLAQPYADILDKTAPDILKKYVDEKFDDEDAKKEA